MSIFMTHRMVAVFALAAVSTAANAVSPPQPPDHTHGTRSFYEFEGRFYEVVAAPAIQWGAAKDAAELLKHAESATDHGVQGHLATINSLGEDAFVHSLRVLINKELWVGGKQLPCQTVNPPPEPGCGWVWINGEPIAATNTVSPYTNWLTGEPNNLNVENHLAIGLIAGTVGWNDEGHLPNIGGYVVEYGDALAPFPSANCAASGTGCSLTGGDVDVTVIKLPGSAVIPAGDEYTVRTWLIRDPPARCQFDPAPLPLDLLGAGGVGAPDGIPDVIIPGYLCTHPGNDQFLVIKTTSAVQIPSGVVAITNDTTELLDPAYDCTAPLLGEHPLEQDVVVFQYDDKDDMLETGFTSIRDPAFNGSVIESTNGCINPSRGSGGAGSYIFVGLSIHQGAAASSQQRLVDLLEHKLDLLKLAVAQARAEGAIKSGDYHKLTSAVNATTNHLQRGNFGEALVHIKKFKATTSSAAFKAVPSGTNWNGEFLMRIDNIAFTHKVKVMLLAP